MQHYAEPQQGAAEESEAARLRDGRTGGAYVERNKVSADSVVIATRAEREDGNAATKALGDGCSAQTSRSEGHAGNHFAIGSREWAEVESKGAGTGTSGRSEERKIDLILRRRHR